MIERRIALGFIHSRKFINKTLSKFDKEYIEVGNLAIIISWCVDYYKANGKSPRHDLVFEFGKWVERSRDPDQVELVEDLMYSLLDERMPADIPYLIDETLKYFDKKRLLILGKRITDSAKRDDLDNAKLELDKYRGIQKSAIDDFFFFEKKEEMFNAFNENLQPLFTLPGAIGSLLNRHFIRAGFVTFFGREKIGKSWLLTDLAMRALRRYNNVAYFEMGDSSKSQMERRMGVYLTKSNYDNENIGNQIRPVMDCQLNQMNTCALPIRSSKVGIMINENERMSYEQGEEIGYNPCVACAHRKKSSYKSATWVVQHFVEEINNSKITKAFELWNKHVLKRNRLMVSFNPTHTVSYMDVRNKLLYWRDEYNFHADVVIIDYMDIMHMHGKDEREQINKTWAAIRSLSIEFNNLVISASQADAASYTKFLIGPENFSGSKTKLAHVTATFGLNKTPEDENRMVMRINAINKREGKKSKSRYVTVLQNLDQGRAIDESY
jgi:hypothetical protein